MSETTPETSELRERLAATLLAHAWNDYTGRCVCGWYVPSDLMGAAIDRAHAEHQTDAVFASGAVTTEDKTTRITHVEFAQMIADAEQRGREEVRARIEADRDGFLDSPNLDRAWIAGWRSATDHHAARIRTLAGPEDDA